MQMVISITSIMGIDPRFTPGSRKMAHTNYIQGAILELTPKNTEIGVQCFLATLVSLNLTTVSESLGYNFELATASRLSGLLMLMLSMKAWVMIIKIS